MDNFLPFKVTTPFRNSGGRYATLSYVCFLPIRQFFKKRKEGIRFIDTLPIRLFLRFY
jgi:hypothetical protein